MIADNYVEAKDEAEVKDMDKFVEFLHDNTGVFGNESRELVTVHAGGRSCVYSPESDSISRDENPVMRHLEKNDDIRVKRNVTVRSRFPDGPKATPRLTIVVVGDGN